MIQLHNVCYAYESGANALEDITLEIPEGQFVAVIGHNGSGKSTLAKLLNALILPTSGEVVIDGLMTSEENNTYDIRQRVGMVFQNPDNQMVTTIVEEDVAFGPENLGVPPPEIRARVDEALSSVGIGHLAKAAPHLLSGGQKQRVAIAGILAMRPKAIVLDEPTAMLDPLGRKEVMKAVRKLHKEGMSIVWITHFMEEAALAERVLVMSKGRIEADAPPRAIFVMDELLKACGLDVPAMRALQNILAQAGISAGESITVEEMCEALCPLLLKT